MSKNSYSIRVLSRKEGYVAFKLYVNSICCNAHEGSFIIMPEEAFNGYVADLKATVTHKLPIKY